MDFKMPKVEIPKIIKDLCQPAYVYFILASFSTLFYIFSVIEKSRYFNTSEFNMNDYTLCGLIVHVTFSIAWIYILNRLCKTPLGKKFAWFFVLLPFLVIALIIIGISGALSYMLMNQQRVQEIDDKVEEQKLVIEGLQSK